MPSYRQSAKIGAAITLFTLAVGAAHAQQSISGTIISSITLEPACSIDGNAGPTGGVNFGSLEFGSHSALFDQVDAQVAGSDGITVLCSPGVEATFKLLRGLNDGNGSQGTHAMSHDEADAYVGYSLYRDTGYSDPIGLEETVTVGPFTDEAITLELYGRAFGDPGLLPAGTYTDTLSVELAW